MIRKYIFPLLIIPFMISGCGTSVNQEQNIVLAENNKDTKIVDATYIGLIDSHSIEVTINGSPIALQINEEQFNQLELLKTDTLIKITYYINKTTSQNILESFQLFPSKKD